MHLHVLQLNNSIQQLVECIPGASAIYVWIFHILSVMEKRYFVIHVLQFQVFFLYGKARGNANYVFISIWLLHYFHRYKINMIKQVIYFAKKCNIINNNTHTKLISLPLKKMLNISWSYFQFWTMISLQLKQILVSFLLELEKKVKMIALWRCNV